MLLVARTDASTPTGAGGTMGERDPMSPNRQFLVGDQRLWPVSLTNQRTRPGATAFIQ
jgi:hypothetical protein